MIDLPFIVLWHSTALVWTRSQFKEIKWVQPYSCFSSTPEFYSLEISVSLWILINIRTIYISVGAKFDFRTEPKSLIAVLNILVTLLINIVVTLGILAISQTLVQIPNCLQYHKSSPYKVRNSVFKANIKRELAYPVPPKAFLAGSSHVLVTHRYPTHLLPVPLFLHTVQCWYNQKHTLSVRGNFIWCVQWDCI